MNKLLIMCSVVALMYEECVFANAYENEEEVSKLQTVSKDDNVRKFGTKDQWQRFFELQGEPQELFFLTPEQAKSVVAEKQAKRDFLIRKLKSLRTQQDINDLTDKLSKLNFKDSYREEDNTVKTGRLIDIAQEDGGQSEEDLSRNFKRMRISDAEERKIANWPRPAAIGNPKETLKRATEAQRHYRVRIKKKH